MKNLSANLVLAAILLGRPAAAGAAVELSGWWTSGWPKGGALAHYGYGIITTGGTGRLSWVSREGRKQFYPVIFTEAAYIDFGPEAGYVVIDPVEPSLGLDVATDHYLLAFSAGFALEKSEGDVRPNLNFLAGVSYHSSASRLTSRRQSQARAMESYASDGITWHAGLGAGIMILLWQPESAFAPTRLDQIFLDTRFGYVRGGHIDYLDWRTVAERADGSLDYEIVKPDISLFILSLGLSLLF